MKRSIFTVLLLTLCCLTSSIAFSAFAQTTTAGISKGETFDYSYNVTWTSTNPSAIPPSYITDLNNTQKIQFKITQVDGSNITLDCIKSFKNGTSTVQSGTINIDSGAINIPYGFLIVRANIEKNQLVYPNGGHQTITDTVTRSYATGQRETNIILSQEPDETITIYFDKIKGIAVDYSYQTNTTLNGQTTTTKETLTNTNSDVWAVNQPTPSVPEISFVVVPLILATASAVLLLSKHAKKQLKL